MVEEVVLFPTEIIPDEDFVFYRIHISDIRDNVIIPGAFKIRGDGMSIDWNRYGTPERLRDVSTVPEDNGVVQSIVRPIRDNRLLSVIHKPLNDNRAHSLINGIPNAGELKAKTRLHLKRCFNWIIKIKEEHN